LDLINPEVLDKEQKMVSLEQVLHIQNQLGEGPRWNIKEQTLYWVDIDGHCFYTLAVGSNDPQKHPVGLPLGALAFRASGGLVLATEHGFAFWEKDGQKLQFFADPEKGKPDARFNDGVVDRHGRFWAGTMTEKGATSSLYRLDPDLSVHLMETGITISNGLGWDPTNSRMYLTDSLRHSIYVYDFKPETGEISNRRFFFHSEEEPGVPDGMTIDRDGFIWSAFCGGGQIIRFDPDGKIERRLTIPTQYVTACIFAGKDLNELYITTSKSLLAPESRPQQPMAGDLFRLVTDFQGFPEEKFAG
jgi:sugar lactone lactonase YvrE